LDHVGAAIRRARQSKGWSIAKLAGKAELDGGYLSRLETGKVTSPGIVTLQKLATALGLSGDAFIPPPAREEATLSTPGPVILVPVVNITLAAGGAVFGETQETVPLSADLAPAGHQLVASRVSGNCMEPDLRDGDMVVIDITNRAPHPGQMVAVLMEDGNMLIKRFVHKNGETILEDNQGHEYRPNGAKIQGVAIQVSHRLP
jgi:transcriptional regulator with XRE-family HTH domain